jgi:mono/diheme cytochrome c family protein
MPPELVFADFICFYQLLRTELCAISARSLWDNSRMKMLRGLLAFALALLCAVSQGAANQNAPPIWRVKRLAFESRIWNVNLGRSSVDQGEISVLNGADSSPKLLARGEAPAWSPDGEKLAFCTREVNGFGQIQVINADGSGQKQLTKIKGGACFPDWAPDGERIAFTAYGGKSPTIEIADQNGENLRPVTEGFGPRWSADSKKLVFYRSINRKTTSSAIWIVNADGSGSREIVKEDVPPPAAQSLGQARFFDASSIVYSYKDGIKSSIFRANLDGTGIQKIAENDEIDLFDPAFSPDSNQFIAQGTLRGGGGSLATGPIIVLFDMSSGKFTRLTSGRSASVVWDNRTAPTATSSSTPGGQALIAQGRSRYLSYKCDECHGPNGEGGPDGPDLIGTRLNAAHISKFLDKPSPDADMKGMPTIPATDPDHQALVAYVLSLKRPSNSAVNYVPPHHRISVAEKAHILDGDFSIEINAGRLPANLKSAFAQLAGERYFNMANPGEKFQVTDVIDEPGLPWRRLFFAGISNDKYFIHYEKGGIAHSSHLAVFAVNSDGKVSFLWGGPGPAAKDLAQLQTMLAAGKFADDLPYYF